jgi:hypothetical protein
MINLPWKARRFLRIHKEFIESFHLCYISVGSVITVCLDVIIRIVPIMRSWSFGTAVLVLNFLQLGVLFDAIMHIN